MNQIVDTASGGERKLRAAADECNRARRALRTAVMLKNDSDIEAALQHISSRFDLPRVSAQLDAACRPATVEEISLHMSHLVGVIKHTDKVDPKLFTPQLIKDVVAERPSIAALISGCRIVRTEVATFLPSIKEVVQAIREAEESFAEGNRAASSLPALIAEGQKRLSSIAEEAAHRREREKTFIRSILERSPSEDPLATGPQLSDCDPVLVDEVRQELGLAP